MESAYQQYFEFIRYSITPDTQSIPNVEGMDWSGLYQFACEQAIGGVVFEGVKRFGERNIKPPFNLLMKWIALSEQIKAQNVLLNTRCLELVDKIQSQGYDCCILKGQGNALLYPEPLSRCPGDIDLFVKGKRKDVIRFVKSTYPHTKAAYQHIDYPVFNDIDVELHYYPTYLNNPIYNKRLQQWYFRQMDKQCQNCISMVDGERKVPVPTNEFNIVFQLAHIWHHFFDEGIGLRQFVDYYFVLRKLRIENGELRVEKYEDTLKYIGLWKFAGAVMYIMKEVLGMDEKYLIVPVDERRGKTLLNEILKGGNFGHHSGLNHENALKKYFQKTCRNMQLVREYPSEALCEPIFRTWHIFWRLAQ